jgi:GT2 family glycosyltransferase
MKISYAITVCNEFKEIQRLISFLVKNKRNEDEIVVLFDSTNGTPSVEEFLRAKSVNGEFNWFNYSFDGHFANMKNRLTDMCTGDYIFQIDADEIISEYCLENLPMVLQYNPVDVLLVPRINTVKGLTQEHINKWGWKVNENGWVNFPDPQFRIYKNNGKIIWKNKVHEVLEAHTSVSTLPYEEPWCLIHKKDIKRQEKQNKYYDTL